MKTPKNKFGLFPAKIEVLIFAVLFLLAFGFNAFAVLASEMETSEIFATWDAPLFISGVAYIAIVMVRALLIFFGKTVKSFQKYSNLDNF